MTDATKICPACAEEIGAEAVVCRYCGFLYRASYKPFRAFGAMAAAAAIGITAVAELIRDGYRLDMVVVLAFAAIVFFGAPQFYGVKWRR